MIDRDLIEVLVALALIVACALSAIATAQPRARKREKQERPTRRRPRRHPSAGEVYPASIPTAAGAVMPVASEAGAPAAARERARPRILTGEPAAAENRAPATRRAIKLAGGNTVLAAGGAVGLLAPDRARVAQS